MELNRPLALDRITEGHRITVEADPAERAAIAVRLLIPSIEQLRCEWTLHNEPRGVVQAHGRLTASLHQECVVSLDPFPASVTEAFIIRFVPAGQETDDGDDPDLPDEVPYEGPLIDLGEATVEQLALALDPYPRKPGAELPASASDEPANAFEALLRRQPPQ